GIFLGCDPLSTTGSLQDQQNIDNTPTGQFRIGVNDQITEENQVLMISADGQALTFISNQFVDVATNQTITDTYTNVKIVQQFVLNAGTATSFAGITSGNIQINPTANAYDDADSSDTTRGLCISADGNTLSFNGQVIAGGSVNYSQGSAISWGTKSLGTDGGFYSDETIVFWRDHALQFDPYHHG
ncbi:MAG: hypothetical protein EZS28_028667, partial [Streblomastix strix]